MIGALIHLKLPLGGVERERARGGIGFQQRQIGEQRNLHLLHRRRRAIGDDDAHALALINHVPRGEPPALFGNGEGAAKAGGGRAHFNQHGRIIF